jgi:hypothetical protein
LCLLPRQARVARPLGLDRKGVRGRRQHWIPPVIRRGLTDLLGMTACRASTRHERPEHLHALYAYWVR